MDSEDRPPSVPPAPSDPRSRLSEAAKRVNELRAGLALPGTEAWAQQFLFPKEDPERRAARIAGSEFLLIFVAVFQVGLLALSVFAWWYVGASLPQALVGVVAGLVLAAGLDALALWALRTGRQGDRWDALWWLRVAGYAGSILLAMLIGTIVQTRIWSAPGVNWGVAAVLNVVILLIAAWTEKSSEEHGLPWPWIGLGLVLTPGLAGWAVASLPIGSDEHTVRRWLHERPAAAGAASPPCAAPAVGADMRVAVALSGGGYRAAVTHAGLLAGLDAQCVPIHIISSVSGGSIIGAAYALGVPPAEFAARLARRKPGLVTAALSMRAVLLDLWWPTGSITEIYREHFQAVFYGDATLADLPERPLLLVNATDPEADVLQAREVFFRGRAPRFVSEGRGLDRQVRVADAVAASGAFPGAFRPKSIRWPASDDTTRAAAAVKERKFLDGGIIDNFGVEGLRRYLTIREADGRLPPRPHVLIVSDASGYGSPTGIDAKADAATLLERGTSYSYEALHRHLYARYTGQDNLFEWMRARPVPEQVGVVPYAQVDSRLRVGTPERLVTVAIPMTASVIPQILARYPGCRGEGGEEGGTIQKRVSAFSTLYELDSREVRDAFWLGYALATIYRPAIVCAAARAEGRPCPLTGPEMAAAAPRSAAGAATGTEAVSCPTLDAVLAR